MAKKHKHNRKQRSIMQMIGLGVFVSIVFGIIGSAVLSMLIVNEWSDIKALDFGVLVILAVSAFLGVAAATVGAEGKRALIVRVTVGIWGFLLLASGVLFVESGFMNLVPNLLATVIGGICAGVIAMRKRVGKHRVRNFSR